MNRIAAFRPEANSVALPAVLVAFVCFASGLLLTAAELPVTAQVVPRSPTDRTAPFPAADGANKTLIDDRPGADFKPLFNGKDLTGWTGNPKLWFATDGVIKGQTTAENSIKRNTFLIWTNGTVENFELRFSYKVVPNNDSGFANSGVQYRSKILDQTNWVVGGYQADFEAGSRYSGILYDEAGGAGGRGIMAARGEKVVWDKDCQKQVAGSVGNSEEIQSVIRKADWNEYVIIAKGNHFQHFINGKPTVDVTDECEAKRVKSGVLALQLHAGQPMTVEFKDIRLKTSK